MRKSLKKNPLLLDIQKNMLYIAGSLADILTLKPKENEIV
jgi:hypothetical protein